jgi:hypothetical protein
MLKKIPQKSALIVRSIFTGCILPGSRSSFYNQHRNNFVCNFNSVHIIYSRGVFGLPDKALKVTEKVIRAGMSKAGDVLGDSKTSKPLENLNDGINKKIITSYNKEVSDKYFKMAKVQYAESTKRPSKISKVFIDMKIVENINSLTGIAILSFSAGAGVVAVTDYIAKDNIDLEGYDKNFDLIIKKASSVKACCFDSLDLQPYLDEEKDDIEAYLVELRSFQRYHITYFCGALDYWSLQKSLQRRSRFSNYIKLKMHKVKNSEYLSEDHKTYFISQLKNIIT